MKKLILIICIFGMLCLGPSDSIRVKAVWVDKGGDASVMITSGGFTLEEGRHSYSILIGEDGLLIAHSIDKKPVAMVTILDADLRNLP
jgi:hypothetical protein